jgi:hypothetical protein
MNSQTHRQRGQGRRLVVDALLGASTFALAFAAVGAATDNGRLLLILTTIALLAFGLLLEPGGMAKLARDLADIGSQPSRPSADLRPRDPDGTRWGAVLDAAIINASGPLRSGFA